MITLHRVLSSHSRRVKKSGVNGSDRRLIICHSTFFCSYSFTALSHSRKLSAYRTSCWKTVLFRTMESKSVQLPITVFKNVVHLFLGVHDWPIQNYQGTYKSTGSNLLSGKIIMWFLTCTHCFNQLNLRPNYR